LIHKGFSTLLPVAIRPTESLAHQPVRTKGPHEHVRTEARATFHF
jgi:hypothetical protein